MGISRSRTGGSTPTSDGIDSSTFVVLRATDPNFVLKWRVEAEEAAKAKGKPGLDRAAIEDYVRRFLPAYARYGGGAPPHVPADRRLVIGLDELRRPVKVPGN